MGKTARLRRRHMPLMLTILFIPYSSITLFGNPYLFLPMVFFIVYFIFSIRHIKPLWDLSGTNKLILPWVFIWLLFFLAIVVNFYSEFISNYRSLLQRIIMYLVFFLMVFNEIRLYPNLKEQFQNAVIFSILLMGFFYFAGFGEFSSEGRFTLFGANSNSIGVWAVVGVLFAFDRVIQKTVFSRNSLYWLIVIFIGFFLIVQTGSRKAVFMTAAGVLIYYVFLNRSTYFKLKLIIPLVIVSLFAVRYTTSETVFMERMEREFEGETVTLGGRIAFWEVGLNIIQEHPIIGAGHGEYIQTMEKRLGVGMSTHNEFITIAINGGIPALLIFLYFLGFLGNRSLKLLKIKNENFTTLPLALLVILIMYLATAGGGLANFYTYFLFAFIAGSTIRKTPLESTFI